MRLTRIAKTKTACLAVCFVLLLCFSGKLPAQAFVGVNVQTVVVCAGKLAADDPRLSGQNGGAGVDSSDAAACRTSSLYQVNPFRRFITLGANVVVPPELLAVDQPLGVFVSANAASAVYFNGKLLGRNGVPAARAAAEHPGLLDAVFYLPRQHIKPGANRLVVRLSGQHSLIKLAGPIHVLAIAPYASPTDMILHYYLPALLPLGVLMAGALYFGGLALRSAGPWRARRADFLVSLVAAFAAAQLMLEVSRGVIAYAYPWHGVRLVLILLCALACGAGLLLHVAGRFVAQRTVRVAATGWAVTLVSLLMIRGFDGKSFVALLVPAVGAVVISIYATWQQQRNAVAYLVVLVVFVMALVLAPYQIFDRYFYYMLAGLVLFLFAQQIQVLLRERQLRTAEQERAARLQLILDEAKEQQTPSHVSVNHTGRMERIASDQIVYCKGARDYVELHLVAAGRVLHNGSLNELEQQLPTTFLRVHRSYLVNTRLVRTLERETSGSGKLYLTTGDVVPVSRRIMPKVRQVLR